jgi:hypothetical protein
MKVPGPIAFCTLLETRHDGSTHCPLALAVAGHRAGECRVGTRAASADVWLRVLELEHEGAGLNPAIPALKKLEPALSS